MAREPQTNPGSAPELKFAHYRVLRQADGTIWELGRGAMGVTYKAYDEELRIEVALKVITPNQVSDPNAQALFLREARAAARVRHPNVATVVYLNTTTGNFFYAMEFVAGESLQDWLRTHGALPRVLAIGFATQIARGLGAIHEQQIVHRDLKPANLMIVAAGREKSRAGSAFTPEAWQIKIIDFGLARSFAGEGLGTEVNAQTIGFRGTALYASPEQCEEHGQIDGRSDLYSLGCIFWEMLTGAPPFRGKTHRELLNQHVGLPVPLPRIAHLPASLQVVLARMLEKDPAARFADADAVVKALERCREHLAEGDERDGVVLTSAPTAAMKEPPGAARFPRSGRIGLAAGCAALMVAGIAWYFTRGQPAASTPVVTPATPAIAAVTPTSSPAPATAPAAPLRKSIAVLPFENLSGRPDDAYLADGLQEEILNSLARVRDLKVISRTSVMEYRGKAPNVREVGQRLGVGTVLEGSVRREGNTLRLTVQLIDTRDDTHLFAANYDRDVNKVLELQSAVARQITEALTATLTRKERGELDRVATNSGDAYDRYLRAVALYVQRDLHDQEALKVPKQLLEEAIRFDPSYADAYALLSQINTWTYLDSPSPAAAAAAKDAFERAFANDPDLPEAMLARGLYTLYVSKDRERALSDLQAVAERRPNSAEIHNVLGFALRRSGRMDEAIGHFVRAWELAPLDRSISPGPLQTLLALRRFPEVIVQTELLAKRFPEFPNFHLVRAKLQSYLANSSEPLRTILRDRGSTSGPEFRREIELALAEFEGRYVDAIRLVEELPIEAPGVRSLYLGSLYHSAGDVSRAEENFRQVEKFIGEMRQNSPTREGGEDELSILALAQSMLGRHAEALANIEVAYAANPESRDATNGPHLALIRSLILVRAGRTQEGYAEVARLLRVPFGSPTNRFLVALVFGTGLDRAIATLTKDDPHFDELVKRPPRL